MEAKVKATIENYNLIGSDERVVVGVSGGPDSMCLVNILFEFGYDIVVCHVNHGLRENANLDEQYVKDYCYSRGIPCYVKNINLKDKDSLNGMSTEEAGRLARYNFFNEIAIKERCSKIATAHNTNDNVETILLNMFRGTGINGIKGILPVYGNLIRPLIDCTRSEIEAYCEIKNLNPRHDESNDEDLYTRNKVRLHIIPYVESNINPNIIETISRLSKIAIEECDYIDKEVQVAYNEIEIQHDEGENIIMLNLKKFNKYHPLIKKKIILKSILNVLGNVKDISKVHVDDIIKMCENNIGGKYLTPNKNIKVSINNHKICIERVF